MLKELIKLANHLDQNGFAKEADYLDSIIVKASPNRNFIILMPVTELKDRLYLYNLVVNQATKIKGSAIQRVESIESLFENQDQFSDFLYKHAESPDFGIQLSKFVNEKGYDVITIKTHKSPGKKTHTIFFDLLSDGKKIGSSYTPLSGVIEGEKPDGSHKSDDQILTALREILV